MSNEKYGARYYQSREVAHESQREGDLYAFDAFIGCQHFDVEPGDSAIMLDHDFEAGRVARWIPGRRMAGEPLTVASSEFAVRFRGYQCGNKVVSLDENVNLPYINGCATRQLFPPERIGDPTFQQLTIPPHTSEQAHHIHPTVRVVYVLEGEGVSIVGQSGNTTETELKPGMVCVLDPMCPHHFRTGSEFLTVLPVHVWSSTPAAMEQNHPMFNGTREV